MKIFIDTANLDKIREVNSWGILDGVTTNPSLVAKENTDFETLVMEICKIVDGPISAEVMSVKAADMVAEARKLAKIHPNIVIKVPMTEEGLKATCTLASEDIKVNMTLVFSAAQALLAAKAGARYVSPFVGRLDDVGQDGMKLIAEIMNVLDNYDFETEVIVASVRDPIHVVEAAQLGAHIATIPYDVLKKMFMHPLTDVGIKRFQDDWAKVPKK
ncbi:MAG: putative transaldolase [Methanomassiliicoccales archaeon PtaU1.Bin030]|nr:MAG: putative transaldolase [Methanomassiliicoccales archaeon PtaU1.Bin030]